MQTLQDILNSASHQHHFAGKLDGYVAVLIEEPASPGMFSTLLYGDGILRQLPVAPESEARPAFFRLVRDLMAKCI